MVAKRLFSNALSSHVTRPYMPCLSSRACRNLQELVTTQVMKCTLQVSTITCVMPVLDAIQTWLPKALVMHYQTPCSQTPALCLYCCADPPAGDVGTNAQYAACPAKETPAAASSSSYSYGQALIVSAPSAAGRVRGPLSLPAGVLSAECLGVAQVGFMARMPASLKVICAVCWMVVSVPCALRCTGKLCSAPNATQGTCYIRLAANCMPASTCKDNPAWPLFCRADCGQHNVIFILVTLHVSS
jgi:hypothetical protein